MTLAPPRFPGLTIDFLCQRKAIDRMDCLESTDDGLHLAPLQRADKVPQDAFAIQPLDFRERFLKAVFSEMPNAGIHGFSQPFNRDGFGGSHQTHLVRHTPGSNGGTTDFIEHHSNPAGNRPHFSIHPAALRIAAYAPSRRQPASTRLSANPGHQPWPLRRMQRYREGTRAIPLTIVAFTTPSRR